MGNNRGFTLVELIIGVAIMSIIGTAITGFMVAGTKGYSSNSREINLQYEAQMTMNQISDFLIECNEVNFDDSAKVLEIVSGNSASANCVKHLIAQRGDLLVYSEIKNGVTSDSYPMSEYIAENGFSVDLSKVIGREDKQVVGVTLNFANKERTYNMSTKITLRNNVDGKYKKIEYAEAAGVTATPTTVPEGWKLLKPLPDGVAPGSTLKLTDYISNDSADILSWSITGNTSLKTAIGETSGTLTVAKDETGVINVTVADRGNPSDNYTFVLPVAKVKSVELELLGTDVRFYPGKIFAIAPRVTAEPEKYSSKFSAVTWEIQTGSDILTAYGNGSFKINTNAAIGRTFGIRAVSKYDASVISNVITGTVVKKTADDVDPEDNDDDPYDEDEPSKDSSSSSSGHINPADPGGDRPEAAPQGYIGVYINPITKERIRYYVPLPKDFARELNVSAEDMEKSIGPGDSLWNNDTNRLSNIGAKNADGVGTAGLYYSLLRYTSWDNKKYWVVSIMGPNNPPANPLMRIRYIENESTQWIEGYNW